MPSRAACQTASEGERKTLNDSLVWMWQLVPRCGLGAELRAELGKCGDALVERALPKLRLKVASFDLEADSSHHDLSAIHHQGLAGNAARRVRTEENRGARQRPSA